MEYIRKEIGLENAHLNIVCKKYEAVKIIALIKEIETSEANLNIGCVSGCCDWRINGRKNKYSASFNCECGEMVLNIDPEPEHYKYCPFCGKLINYR